MHLPTAVVLASTASMAAAHPYLSRRAAPAIPNTSTFDILLAGNMNGDMGTLDENVQVMILDLEENEAATIADLKTAGKTVLCYFSAGTYEPNRDASAQFQDGDLGNTMKDWPDEKWLNVESENVRKIMTARIQAAADKGCMGVDPDNVDGYQKDNDDGFGKPASVHAEYVKFLAGEAASRNLAIGLKNALDLIPDVVDVVQFAVNEQCHEYGECDAYKPFTDAGKAVFNIEYNGQCGDVDGVVMSTVTKELDLSKLGGQCNAGGAAPAKPSASKTGAAPSATGKPATTQPAATKPAPTKSVTTQPAGTTTAPVATQPASSVQPAKPTAPKPTPSSTVPDEEDENEDEDEDEDDAEGGDDEEEEEPARPHHKHQQHSRS